MATAAIERPDDRFMRGPDETDRLDVTQPHLYTSHSWHAPFRELREQGGIYF